MSAQTPGDEALVAALCAALAPYPWRQFTPELLARFALAARDRQELAVALSEVHGASLGSWERLSPAERADGRLALLGAVRGAEASLLATCRNLVGGLGLDLR